MNRAEVLLEALKETERHIEVLIKFWNSDTNKSLCEARDRAGEIECAILADKPRAASLEDEDIMQSNIELREMAHKSQLEVQRLSDELHTVSAERDSIQADLDEKNMEIVQLRAFEPVKQPLENILSALRFFLKYHDERKSGDETVIYGVHSDHFAASLNVGDLRRWVESEGKS